MKLISFERSNGELGFGALADNQTGVIDLGARLGLHGGDGDGDGLRRLLQAGELDRARRLVQQVIGRTAAATTGDIALDELRFDCPIRQPEKIICIGVNYADRNEEYKDGSAAPAHPSVFLRFARSFVGHGRAIRRPPESTQLDYEGEIAIVIGKAGRRIAQADALSHIAGLTCLNEGTIRDWVRHGKFNVTQGKNWDASGAIGPWLVTSDEFSDLTALTVSTRVNGQTRQHDTTARLMFPFAMLISYVSTWTTLVPGDVIATGTPTGAGVRFDPPKFLVAGDVVEVEVSGVGVLRNPIEDEE
jgi:2-keto-4-pentenoate hydratase/2-oxohepta-3-ene-1,7-dioic acid hydratase in catechol pathway